MKPIQYELNQAAGIIWKAITTLNRSSHECKTCGLTVHNDSDEYRAHIELTAVATKLQKWADILGDE